MEEDNKLAKVDKQIAPRKSTGDMTLNMTHLTLNQINFIGRNMAESGMFPDLNKDSAKAMVKILAGQEIGVTPFQALSNINIIQGKAAMSANLMAAKVKGSSKYDYRPKISATSATVTILQWDHNKAMFEELGDFTFTMDDAKRMGLAGKDNWVKYPQNMLFARAISNAVRIYAPDVFNGNLVYDPDELGAVTNGEGQVLELAEGDNDVQEAIQKIQKAKDEDELTDIVQNLDPEVQKNVVEQASMKFNEFNNPKEEKETKTK